MNLEGGAGTRRRRGQELENAILDAAWDTLIDRGYDGFTFESIAERAATSRSVLYRRWSTVGDLVLAMMRRHREVQTASLPDTGSLRGDILALLNELNGDRSPIMAMISIRVGTFYDELGMSPAQLRETYLGDHPLRLDTVIARAVERGELPPEGLAGRVRDLPFDLLRHEVLMTLRPVSTDVLREIVDDVFLPLATSSHDAR